MVVQPYVYLTHFGGLYNDNWLLQSASTFHTTIQQTYFLYGLTNRMDLEVAPQWLANGSQGESVSGFGDLPVSLGVQLIRDREEWWFPDLRLWIQEVFPIGRYTNLDPKRASGETTGGGFFATTIGLGIQKLHMLGGEQVFRYRLNLPSGFFEATHVSGFNAYGGGFGPEGCIQPGTVTTVTMAGEYSLTRHWLLALDISYQTANATRFSGLPGVGLNGEPAQVRKGSSTLMSVAPAVEYIYNGHLGLIGGPWISVTGRNAAPFVGAVLAVYLFF